MQAVECPSKAHSEGRRLLADARVHGHGPNTWRNEIATRVKL
jgi:hypothetical protein